jgi:hypothetical protein
LSAGLARRVQRCICEGWGTLWANDAGSHHRGGGENVVGVVEWTTKGTSTDYSIIVKLPFLVTIVFENAAHITGSWPLRSGEICPKLHLPVHTVCDIGALLSRLQSFSSYLVKLSFN